MANTLLQGVIGICFLGSSLVASVAYAAHDPVIVMTGMSGDLTKVQPIKDFLVKNGWASERVILWKDSSGFAGDVPTTAKEVEAQVDTVLKNTGASKVVLITWSSSTISSRYYLKNLSGASKVSQYISFAGPHHGISAYTICQGQKACAQWGPPNGPFITALNAGTEVPGSPTVKYLTLRGSSDVNAAPVWTAILAGANENVLYNGLTHYTLITDAAALTKVRDFITANEPPAVPTPTMTACAASASGTSATVSGAATQDTGPVTSYRVKLNGPTVIDDAAAGSGAGFSKPYPLSNGYYAGSVTATNSKGVTSGACYLSQFLVGQTVYSEAVTDTVVNHFVAKRLTTSQYTQLGARYSYSTPFTLYNCHSTWTNDQNCGPMN